MSTILNTFTRALQAIAKAFAAYPLMGLCGPIWWPTEIYREASTRRPR